MMWFATSMGDPVTGPLMMISTVVKGSEALAAGQADPVVGLLIHVAATVLFGVAFGFVVPMLRTNGTLAVAGMLYGGALYVVNFLVLAPIVAPVLEMANQPFEVLSHVMYGLFLSLAFFSTGARRSEPVLAIARKD